MNWSEKAWNVSESIYKNILELPFLKELINGTLPPEKFYFYLQQDSIYLSEYSKILAGISTRLTDIKQRETFLSFSSTSMAVESALHASYLKDAPKPLYKGPSPTCLLYTGFLAKQFLFYSVEATLAAVLPCFWIYQKIGDYIRTHQVKNNNPYQNWIDTYSSPEFAEDTKKVISICDVAAEKSSSEEEMTEAFLYASKMEWMFWNSAYHMEKWPVS